MPHLLLLLVWVVTPSPLLLLPLLQQPGVVQPVHARDELHRRLGVRRRRLGGVLAAGEESSAAGALVWYWVVMVVQCLGSAQHRACSTPLHRTGTQHTLRYSLG